MKVHIRVWYGVLLGKERNWTRERVIEGDRIKYRLGCHLVNKDMWSRQRHKDVCPKNGLVGDIA